MTKDEAQYHPIGPDGPLTEPSTIIQANLGETLLEECFFLFSGLDLRTDVG